LTITKQSRPRYGAAHFLFEEFFSFTRVRGQSQRSSAKQTFALTTTFVSEKRTLSRLRPVAYLLKYIHAVSANKTIATTQREELLISVFLAMFRILIRRLHPRN